MSDTTLLAQNRRMRVGIGVGGRQQFGTPSLARLAHYRLTIGAQPLGSPPLGSQPLRRVLLGH
ncbi:hypothetical protein [Cryobacterium sp. MLB-32]|uniref:hypothetical protein n=1 Tax=Cryobacterium sp. MLB-32 TaxID=1529318 RepID=UPI0012E046D4|nr:hypothetical protein [Cryobacterium sp. MLB-32]